MIKINLAPPPTKTHREPAFTARHDVDLGLVFGLLLTAIFGALGVHWWRVSLDIASLSEEIARNEQERTRLAEAIVEGQRVKRDGEELERRVNALERVARGQARPVHLLSAMAEVVPPELWLTRVEEKGQQIRLAGAAYASEILADFMANLKASGRFKEVDLVESRQDLTKSPRLITFEVSCRFEV